MTGQEFQDIAGFLEETPENIRQLADGLIERDLRWKPSDDEFSVVEQVCHLRDIEREGYTARIGKLLTENQPTLADIDGGRLARERDYNSEDFETALTEFARERKGNVQTIKTLSPDQLKLGGTLEGVGAITLERLLLLMREHDRSHREELGALRARLGERAQH